MHRYFKHAIVHSILIKTAQKGTYKDHAAGRVQKNRMPLIAVDRNVGSTTHWDPKLAPQQQYSFGTPTMFLRFNFTSAIKQIPYAYVEWCQFTATKFSRCHFKGHMTQEEWDTGPRTRVKTNPFISCDEFLPSRFALAYKENLDVCFLALDPERVGEDIICSGETTDLGDETTDYLKDMSGTELHPALAHFLTMHGENDDL